jgi:hypothetical protein
MGHVKRIGFFVDRGSWPVSQWEQPDTMKKKKSPLKTPKVRHGWAINPKTRVKPSKKTYRRKTAKKAETNWVDELFD